MPSADCHLPTVPAKSLVHAPPVLGRLVGDVGQNEVADPTPPGGGQLRADRSLSERTDRPVFPVSVMREMERHPAQLEQLVLSPADDEHGLTIGKQAFQKSSDHGHQRILHTFTVDAAPVSRAQCRTWSSAGDGASPQVVDQARVGTVGDQPIPRTQMLGKPVVLVQPPKVRTREQEVAGALLSKLLELRDGLRPVGRVVPRVFSVGGAREVQAVSRLQMNQLRVALADHRHGRALVNQAAHQSVDPMADVGVLGLWIAWEPTGRTLLDQFHSAVNRVQLVRSRSLGPAPRA